MFEASSEISCGPLILNNNLYWSPGDVIEFQWWDIINFELKGEKTEKYFILIWNLEYDSDQGTVRVLLSQDGRTQTPAPPHPPTPRRVILYTLHGHTATLARAHTLTTASAGQLLSVQWS